MNETLTVYTLPHFVQCTATKRALDNTHLPYNVIDLTTNQDALELLKALGHSQAPVVTVGDANWSGYRPDLITAVAAARATDTRQELA